MNKGTIYMVQTYYYSGYQTDDKFPTMSRVNAENYMHHLALSYADEGTEYEWEFNELLVKIYGVLFCSTEIVEMELDVEL